MSHLDDASNAAQNLTGKAKETVGEAVGNQDLANEGKVDQIAAEAKDAGGDLVDAVKEKAGEALDAVKGIFDKK